MNLDIGAICSGYLNAKRLADSQNITGVCHPNIAQAVATELPGIPMRASEEAPDSGQIFFMNDEELKQLDPVIDP